MTEESALKLFKCMADKSRLQILKSLAIEDMYVERLAQRLNLTPPTISFHLKKLEDVQAVTSRKEQYYTIYSLNKTVFMRSLLDMIMEESTELTEQQQREEAYNRKVINSFFSYGKLKSIPAQRKKERIVLLEIAKAFEKGKVYTEREVNIIIADYYDDFCTIRRDMIAEGILDREDSKYTLII